MKKLLIILFLISTNLFSQPPCPPQSPCWCANKPPNHPCHGTVNTPINGGIIFLLIFGVGYGAYAIRKRNANKLG